MSLLTAEEVTNLYLYGIKNLPANIEDEALIRSDPLSEPTSVNVDINEYMTSGPGRFASPAFFDVVEQFFAPLEGELFKLAFPASTNLAPGIYSKYDLFTAFGIGKAWVGIQQSLYDDGQDNYLERAYIWESTAFQIDGNAKFVINADGSRYIQDFGIIPYSVNGNTENFDLKSDSGFSKLVNFALEPLVDPSGIGRTVDIYFDGTRNLQNMFTHEDYVNAAVTAVLPNPGLVGTIVGNAFSFTQQLFNSGSTRFLYDNKPILYGTNGNDSLSASKVNWQDTPLLNEYKSNGVVLIAGAGDDALTGSTADDYLLGGYGNDTLKGGKGFDTYIVSNGDTISDNDGVGKILFDNQELHGGTKKTGEHEWKDGYGNTYSRLGNKLFVVSNDKQSMITIQNFTNNKLGIHLDTLDDIKKEVNTAKSTSSPIILDLNNNGVETTGVNGWAYFDHAGDGFAERTGWVGVTDGLLVRDINNNGRIDNGNELFGSETLLADGNKAANGFEALKALDSNGDNQINADDAAFANLQIWIDADGDGSSQPNELSSLQAASVTAIATAYLNSDIIDAQGNAHRQTGSYTRADGTQAAAEDVWFAVDKTYSIAETWVDVPDDITGDSPDLSGYGVVRDLWQTLALDTNGNLKALVLAYQAETDEGQRRSLVNDIIYHWTSADQIAPQSRGSYVDARQLVALEHLLGENFYQTDWGINPGDT
ncbi:MAG: hypothetical protein PHD53_06045, partial [Methylococcales bacterium]|nr:hypothetical protein [Methylococcales bacterium]